MKIKIANATADEMTLLNALIPECERILKECNVNYGKITEISVNRRAKKRFGCCKNQNDTYVLEVSEELFNSKSPDTAVLKVLLHEYCHSVPEGHGHKLGWKTAAEKINKKYGLDITRTDSYESLDIPNTRIEKAKYTFECKKCGLKIFRSRASNFTKHPNDYIHSGCGGHFQRCKGV